MLNATRVNSEGCGDTGVNFGWAMFTLVGTEQDLGSLFSLGIYPLF
jgi:hypothetical protein